MNPSGTPKATRLSTLRALGLVLILLGLLPSLRAEQFGLFTYEKAGNTAVITGYPRDAVGAVEIPAVIAGLPVTGIRGDCFPESGVPVLARAGARVIKNSPGNRPAEIPWCGYDDYHPGAFSGCTGLTSITIPSSVTAIGDLAFSGCTGLTSVTLPSSITIMGRGAFSGCTGLTRVTLEKGLTTIGGDTFVGCTKLESFVVEPGNTVFSSAEGVLFNAAQTALLSFPQGKAGHYGIPSSVNSIGGGAFSGCTGLTSVTIPNGVTEIQDWTFAGCIGLTHVTIPSSVTNLGTLRPFPGPWNRWEREPGGVFAGCTRLASVSLSSNLVSIGEGTFAGCIGLTDITLPSSIGFIGGNAFAGCAGLTNVLLPSNLMHIGWGAFSRCTGLTSVTIPGSVRSIERWVFAGTTGLTNVILQPGLTTIGSAVFSGCTGLISVTLPASLIHLSDDAFHGCTVLESYVVEPGNTVYASDDGVLLNAARTELIRCPAGRVSPYTIPSSITRLGAFAFSDCTRLTGVTLSKGVTEAYAFSGCAALQAIEVVAEHPLFASVDGVLFTKNRSFLLQYPIGRAGSYTIPSNVTHIVSGAFSGCAGLTSVTLSEGVTSIGDYAFARCTRLTGVIIPSSVALIYARAFAGCTALTRAVFLGNAPSASQAFVDNSPEFTIHYLSSRTGFSSPTWNGHPATMINEAKHPAASWLLTHGLWYDSDLNQDPDGDGVNLLTAYALNLDPRLNLQSRLPAPELGDDTLSLNFHASSPGITYRVETSTDLADWTTTGVTQPAPGPDGRSTATVVRNEPHRFLRLVVRD